MTGASFFSSFRVKAALSVELLHQAGSAYEARNPPPLPTIAARANYDPCRRRQKVPVAREQRKLAAILADVVGYSRLMGRETAERLTCGGGWTPFPLKVCVSFALRALLIERSAAVHGNGKDCANTNSVVAPAPRLFDGV